MARHSGTSSEGPVRAGEVWRINDNTRLTSVHRFEDCAGPCPLHSPSDHSMIEFTLSYRDDRGFFERICEHGIGHPDPDSLTYLYSIGVGEGYGVHGCDGCCHGAY